MDTTFEKGDHHQDGGSIAGTQDHPEDFINGVNDTDPDYDDQGFRPQNTLRLLAETWRSMIK